MKNLDNIKNIKTRVNVFDSSIRIPIQSPTSFAVLDAAYENSFHAAEPRTVANQPCIHGRLAIYVCTKCYLEMCDQCLIEDVCYDPLNQGDAS